MEWESLSFSPDESIEDSGQTDDLGLPGKFDAYPDSDLEALEPEEYYDSDDRYLLEELGDDHAPAADFEPFERLDNSALLLYEEAPAFTGLDTTADYGDTNYAGIVGDINFQIAPYPPDAHDVTEPFDFPLTEVREPDEVDYNHSPGSSSSLIDLGTGYSEDYLEAYAPDSAFVPVAFDPYADVEGGSLTTTQEPGEDALDDPRTSSLAQSSTEEGGEQDWGLPEEPLGPLHDAKIVPPSAPFEDTVIRKESPNVPNPTKYGFQATGPDVELRPGEHALGEHLNPRGGPSPTPFISASENPKGAPNIDGKPYHIGVEEARRAGAEFYSNADVTADLEAMAKESPRYQARTEMWKANQLRGEQEALFKGDVPASAVETGGMRALKTAGRVAGVVGAALTVYDLAEATQESVEEGTPAPIIAEGVRQVGGWGGAIAGAQAGAALGAAVGLTTGPGAIVTGIAGGLIGGVAGFFAADQVADLIHKDE
ncbi:MAG: hypothetical protein H7Y22_18225 [Gemmatimonadaceae bacterium]|nr:hypothetical protein [Gloeobacterales cyanobacterium ES-bin-141]